ncbi:hypothetical protein PTKIN_Ptkin05aG0061800 [Pterospermum kingtungense]
MNVHQSTIYMGSMMSAREGLLCVCARVWKIFTDCFNCLSVAALINEKILCVHGGLSPDLKKLDQIRNIARSILVPDRGLLCDLLWADFDKDVEAWGESDRSVSYVVEDGYEFFAKRQLVTIFSALNYCAEFDNILMAYDECCSKPGLKCHVGLA